MRSRSLRLLFTLTTLVVVWLVASPAMASEASLANKAPLCDPRGAITFAPPPQMQEPSSSLDIGVFEDCSGHAASESKSHAATRGQAPVPSSAASLSSEPLAGVAAVAVPGAPSERLHVPGARAEHVPSGIRSTVDRPPRA